MMDKNDANQNTRRSVLSEKEPKKQNGAVTFLDIELSKDFFPYCSNEENRIIENKLTY